MKVLACRPGDDQFWIGCDLEEANNIFLPHLSKEAVENYERMVNQIGNHSKEYWNAVMDATETDEIFHAYFNVSRDASICFPQVPHFPFANLWNGYSPFRKIDTKTIHSLDELKNLKMTYKGIEYDFHEKR